MGQSRAPGCFPCIVLDEDGHSTCNSCFEGSYQEFILRNSLDLWFACLRTYSMLAQKKGDYQHNLPEGFILDRIVDILQGVSGKWCSRWIDRYLSWSSPNKEQMRSAVTQHASHQQYVGHWNFEASLSWQEDDNPLWIRRPSGFPAFLSHLKEFSIPMSN